MKKPILYILTIIGILLLAGLVRTIHLSGSFWLDEAAQALESARPLIEQLQIQEDFQPPLYHLLVHLWMGGGVNEWWLRLTSILPGLITILFTIRLGKKLFDDHTGLIAGMFLATSQFHTFYSQELRPYSLAAMWGVIMVDALVDWWQGKYRAWLWLLLSGLAGLYTTYVFPFLILGAAAATVIFHRRRIKQFALIMLGMAAGFLPWLPGFFSQLQAGTTLSATSEVWSRIVSPPLYKMIPLVFTKFLVGRLSFDANLTDMLMVGLMAAVTVFLLNRAFRKKSSLPVLVLLLVPLLSAFLVSLKIPILDPKRVLYLLPLLYLLISAGIGTGVRSLVATVIILSINLLAVTEYAYNPDAQREPWRTAVAQIETSVNPDSLVVFAFSGPFAPWQWYQQQDLATIAIANPAAEPDTLMFLAAAAPRVSQIVVFDYLMDMTDPGRLIYQTLEDNGSAETGFVQYPGIGKIRLYESPLPVTAATGTMDEL